MDTLRIFCATIIIILIPLTGYAATLNVSSMTITGGTLALSDSTGEFVVNPDTGLTVSPFTMIGADTDLVGGYIGSGGGGIDPGSPTPDAIASLSYFGAIASIYTAASNLGDANTPADTITGGVIPSGSLDNVSDTITVDLSSLFMNWNDSDIHSGTGKADGTTSASATGVWNPVTGDFSLSWQSLTGGGPSAGIVAFISLDGVASPVPIPAAFWLFMSGLLGLIGTSRRK